MDYEAEEEGTLPEFLTVAELSALVRADKKTLYAEIKANRIPGARRIGNIIRVHRRTVLDWLSGKAVPRGQ
jgi:excisionase family DNA binding protein